MHQKWRDLLFLHWPISTELLRPLVPPQLDLDLFEGTAYVGLIPFRMVGVRPIGSPAMPRLSSFCETNVRTYVHFRGRDPGVWFFSLDAANALAVKIARAWFHLPYHFSRLYLEEEIPRSSFLRSGSHESADSPILYAGVRHWPEPTPASYVIRAQAVGRPQAAMPGTLEHFLVERYILYTISRDRLARGYVQHAPYPLQNAEVFSLSENMLAANYLRIYPGTPISHFARGVDVKVFNLRRVLEEP